MMDVVYILLIAAIWVPAEIIFRKLVQKGKHRHARPQ